MAPKLLLAVTLLSLAVASSSALPRLGGLGGAVQYIVPEGATNGDNKTCNAFGTVGECSDNPVNDSLDSAAAHRSLMWTRQRYISYTAMRKNSVPCSRRGVSYYNCRPGKAVNPYRRGCSAITMCARVW